MSKETRFPWTASVTSAKGYPIEVHVGYLATEAEFITPLPKGGVVRSGWEFDGQEMNSGGSIMPTQFALTWVSYAEKKFWKIKGTLPADTLLALFRKGVENYDRRTGGLKHETYQQIVVAVAPGGTVAVFLTDPWHRVEVGRYQATETFIDVNAFYDNSRQRTQQEFYDWWYEHTVSDSLKAVIAKEGIPFELWKTVYPQKYKWRFKVRFYKEDRDAGGELIYLNGEATIRTRVDTSTYSIAPLPKKANFYFAQKWAEAEFDGEEIVRVFKQVSKGDSTLSIEIVGKVGFEYKDMTFIVKAGNLEIPLQKVKVKLWNN